MSQTDEERHVLAVKRMIDLSNELAGEGNSTELVSQAMLSAAAVYSTFVVTGNTGGLTESGVDKVVASFRKHLLRVQEMRKIEDDQRRQASEGNA